MRLNEKIEVVGEKVLLVPYDEHLVPRYHGWMKSPELLESTASSPLSLQEEYDMQKSWRDDSDKLTFIVLDKEKASADEVNAMIGDANLFLAESNQAEVMIMIAEKNYRRRGFGREALLLILRYGVEYLGITKYEAKIGRENLPSIQMFQKIGFEKTSESEVFNEVTFSKYVTDSWKEEMKSLSFTIKHRI